MATARSGESARQSSDWLWINQNGSAAPSSASPTATSVASPPAPTATTTNETNGPHHRVLLLPRLAGKPGDWEEGAPEDLLATLEQSTVLAAAVLYQVSSRVRVKCEPAAASLRANATQMLALAALTLDTTDRSTKDSKRSVVATVVQGLQQSSAALLVPVMFGSAPTSPNAPSIELVHVLSALYPRPADHQICSDRRYSLASAVLSTLCSHFPSVALVDAADSLLRPEVILC